MKTAGRALASAHSPDAADAAEDAFARETVVCVEPDGTRKLVTIEVGRPVMVGRHEAR
jgi:hypothetical protein